MSFRPQSLCLALTRKGVLLGGCGLLPAVRSEAKPCSGERLGEGSLRAINSGFPPSP